MADSPKDWLGSLQLRDERMKKLERPAQIRVRPEDVEALRGFLDAALFRLDFLADDPSSEIGIPPGEQLAAHQAAAASRLLADLGGPPGGRDERRDSRG